MAEAMKTFLVTAEIRFTIRAHDDEHARVQAIAAIAAGGQEMEDLSTAKWRGMDLVCVTEEDRNG